MYYFILKFIIPLCSLEFHFQAKYLHFEIYYYTFNFTIYI